MEQLETSYDPMDENLIHKMEKNPISMGEALGMNTYQIITVDMLQETHH